jgi:hypothetical protein
VQLPEQQSGNLAAVGAVVTSDAAEIAGAEQVVAGSSFTTSNSSSRGCAAQLQLARRCPLAKLAQRVGQRGAQGAGVPAAATAADEGVVDAAAAAASGVRCAAFTEPGRLAVGLASGHVCLLRLRASR